MKRLILLLVVLLTASCGGRQEVFDLPVRVPGGPQIALPEPVPASPAYAVQLDKAPPEDKLHQLEKLEGVAVMTPVAVEKMRVVGPHGVRTLRVGSIAPLAFRSLAPPATRDADFVWSALMAGQAVVTFDAQDQLDLSASNQIRIGLQRFSVGAFADNGVPNIADVLIVTDMAKRTGIGKPRLLLVGAKSGTTIETLGKALRNRLPNARLRRLLPFIPEPFAPDEPEPAGQVTGPVGTMSFQILKNGFIRPDPAWVAANIASGPVPILGQVTCHRIMFGQLTAALQEIQEQGLSSAIDPSRYGGCYVPRFINRDPKRSLSMHAFGLAVDLNVSTNHYGTRGDIDRRVVSIFERWGFEWGGRWNPPDPMHFELDRLIQT